MRNLLSIFPESQVSSHHPDFIPLSGIVADYCPFYVCKSSSCSLRKDEVSITREQLEALFYDLKSDEDFLMADDLSQFLKRNQIAHEIALPIRAILVSADDCNHVTAGGRL